MEKNNMGQTAAGQERGNFTPGLDQENFMPGMDQGSFVSGMVQENFTPGVVQENIAPGMVQENIAPGMDQDAFAAAFCSFLREALRRRGIPCRLQPEKIRKSNGRLLPAIIVKKEGTELSPCIYTEDIYQAYCGGAPLAELAEKSAEAFLAAPSPAIDSSLLADYSFVRPRLTFRLYEQESNRLWLEDKIWSPCGSFAKVCYIDLGSPGSTRMAAAVSRSQLALLRISPQQLLADTEENYARQEPVFRSMAEMLGILTENMLGTASEGIPGERMEDPAPLYVLSSGDGWCGAAMMGRSDILRGIGEKLGRNYYILPSSIHELIILPDTGEYHIDFLRQMVAEVNRTEVDPDDRLSGIIHYYNAEQNLLTAVD